MKIIEVSLNRENAGFTLIELLVVVVIIGILAAIALPNFIGAQRKAKLAGVKANMHTTQICAESYGTDSGGYFGSAWDSIVPYLPGGGNSINSPGAFVMFTNPLTGVRSGFTGSTATSTVMIQAERTSVAKITTTAAAGDVGYSGFNSGAGIGVVGARDTYAIDGADDGRSMLMGNNGHLILSHQ